MHESVVLLPGNVLEYWPNTKHGNQGSDSFEDFEIGDFDSENIHNMNNLLSFRENLHLNNLKRMFPAFCAIFGINGDSFRLLKSKMAADFAKMCS